MKPEEFLQNLLELEAKGQVNAVFLDCYKWVNDNFCAGRFADVDEVLILAAKRDLTKQMLTALVSFSMVAFRENRLPGMLVLLKENKGKLEKVFRELY